MKNYYFSLLFFISCFFTFSQENEKQPVFPVVKTDKEWKEQLNGMEYYVLRRSGTEYAFSSALNDEKRKGIYRCAGCDAPLFRSENKYDSGSGWPSFDRPLTEKAIFYAVDYEIGVARTEERCANCGSHLGHVFEDGPRETTGLRHCINGVALKFVPDEN